MNKQLITSHRTSLHLLEKILKYETNEAHRIEIENRTQEEMQGSITYKEILLSHIEAHLKQQGTVSVLEIKVADYNFSNRLMRIFKRAGIITFHDLVQYSKDEIMKFRNMGQKSFMEIEDALIAFKLKLKQ